MYVRTFVNFIARGEAKTWQSFRPCSAKTSKPSCDRQIFKRDEVPGPDQVKVLVSNDIDTEMVKFWAKIDSGFKSLRQPEVCANAGCIRGKYETGRIKPYEAFYGIPFAEPPVGKLRLENPVPYSGWKGYWDASYPRDDCYQRNYYLPGKPVSGSEDCLYLNVYRPNTWSSDKKLPVMVYIHGGSFASFSSHPRYFGPEYFMDNGEVILVTLNYRLGFLGFLCSEDGAVKGNFGLKDQQLALEWVAKNIASVGGDANAITLSGQSAGGASTQLHMLNSKSQGLFHQSIIMSGNGIAPFVYPIDFASQFREAAKNVGLDDWKTASSYSLANQLKKVDALKLVFAVDQTYAFNVTPPVPVRPCVEGHWDGAFLTEDPRKMWAEGRFKHKPILTGVTSDEELINALIVVNETILQQFNAKLHDLLPIQIDFPPRHLNSVLKFYLNGQDYIDDSNKGQYLKSPYTILKYTTETDLNLGVSHIDDLMFLFTMPPLFPVFDPDSPEGRMSDVYVRTFVNFIARGEAKTWRSFRPCTVKTSKPSCDRQIFKRDEVPGPDQVKVLVSNDIDTEMMKLWTEIDDALYIE
ncbi:juvenile hormone esterase-like [Phlebotomus argentipes]|uniref:juvenile hormone esterase-like n=1 Tax=Phlebotomus argentipes TaxID=94469 RepID=UPI0028933F51|nr:juvenile hormone esterase-like [Phlebotomus argentipes]